MSGKAASGGGLVLPLRPVDVDLNPDVDLDGDRNLDGPDLVDEP